MQTMTTYSTQEAAAASGATLRQIDYWDRTDVIRPAVPARGSGSRRGWAPEQIRLLRVIRHLANAGASLDLAKRAAAELALLPLDFWKGSHIVDGRYLLNLDSLAGGE